MKICNFIFFTLVGVCVGGMIWGNVNTVSGTTGDVNCSGGSCAVKGK